MTAGCSCGWGLAFSTLDSHNIGKSTEDTAAHEMGHQIQLLLKLENDRSIFNIFNSDSYEKFQKAAKEEICAITKNKYKSSNTFISMYGSTDDGEWFAEVFAYLRYGGNWALCKAMKDYLEKNGLHRSWF